jgi:hypothetical protein
VPLPAGSAPVSATTKSAPVEFEFDGGATDITDVAMADFPVLTDAVEPGDAAQPQRLAPALPATAAVTTRATVVQPTPAPRAAASVPAPKPVAAPASRVETAYAAQKPVAEASPAPKPSAAAPFTPAAAAAKPAAPPARAPSTPAEDDDQLRQTQTMRAIAVAKSIDDISSTMAETLFGDAELDLVTAALASAAEWPDDDEPPAPQVSKPEPPKAAARAEPAKPAPPVDDPFDLFGLGDDAPLELIDDSTLPPANRKSASR